MEKELKPCPFCGNFATVYQTKYPNGGKPYVICCLHTKDCYLDDAIEADFETEEEAIEAWNRRAKQ